MGLVNYEVKGMVGIITISRPEAMNALNSQVLAALEQVFDAVDLDAVRAVVLTGAGDKAFVAGADIAEMMAQTYEENIEYTRRGNELFFKIENFKLPVIAAVNGYALGGGTELALCCDIRICSDNALFGLPETGLGITPGFGGTQRLPRVVGLGHAKQMIFTGKNVNAEEAMRIGLVNAVYPQEELMPAAMKMAERIAANAPIAVQVCKSVMNRGISEDIRTALEIEGECIGTCFDTEDRKEGLGAFVEKRKEKNFKNR